MRRSLPPSLFVAAAAAFVFFTNLGAASLFDDDEAKNAGCGREMFVRGDWIVPTFNENLRTDKPILLYWLMLASYHVFGVTEFAARFWSAVCGVGTCVLTYHIGKRLFSQQAGLWAGLMIASCLMFTVVARAATPDSTLIFLSTLSLYLFTRFGISSECWKQKTAGEEPTRFLCWKTLLPAYCVMALAVLAKGPVGVLMPCAVIGLFLFIESVLARPKVGDAGDVSSATWGDRFRAGCRRWFQPVVFGKVFLRMRPELIIVCLAVIAVPWYAAVTVRTDGAWLRGFLGNHNVGRFLKPMEGHRGPVFYYPLALLIGFFPWSVFLPWAIVRLFRRMRIESPERRGLVFLGCWIGVYLVLFTMARTKLPNYILPCYPAVALCVAWLFHDRPWTKIGLDGRLYRMGILSLSFAGLLIAVGLTIAMSILMPGEELLGLVGLVPLFGGAATFRLFQKDRMQAGRRCLMGTAFLFIVLTTGFVAPRVSRHLNGPSIAAALRERGDVADVATFQYSVPGLVFYSERRIEICKSKNDITEWLSRDGSYLVTRSDRMQMIEPFLPAGTRIVHRQRRFLRDHDILVLTRESPHPNGRNLQAAGPKEPRRN